MSNSSPGDARSRYGDYPAETWRARDAEKSNFGLVDEHPSARIATARRNPRFGAAIGRLSQN
jgi:hypothetical protein